MGIWTLCSLQRLHQQPPVFSDVPEALKGSLFCCSGISCKVISWCFSQLTSQRGTVPENLMDHGIMGINLTRGPELSSFSKNNGLKLLLTKTPGNEAANSLWDWGKQDLWSDQNMKFTFFNCTILFLLKVLSGLYWTQAQRKQA